MQTKFLVGQSSRNRRKIYSTKTMMDQFDNIMILVYKFLLSRSLFPKQGNLYASKHMTYI